VRFLSDLTPVEVIGIVRAINDTTFERPSG